MEQISQNCGLNPKDCRYYVGIDVHKSKWVTSIYRDKTHVKTYSMSPDADVLIRQLKSICSDGSIHCCYEAGFSGFWLQRLLEQAGITCNVVHAADVPSTDRTKKRKTDQVDSQNLALMLSRGLLNKIYMPSQDQEDIRGSVRARQALAKDKRRSMARIRSCLNRVGLTVCAEMEKKLWTQVGMKWLAEHSASNNELFALLSSYKSNRQNELDSIRRMSKQIKEHEQYKQIYELLLSVPGVGRLTSALLIGEIGDINRFKNLDHLAGYCGLVPDERSSGEKTRILGLTRRRNTRLRTALVESAWIARRHDEQLRSTYQKAIAQGKPSQVAVIRVARKLLNRIRVVWKNKRMYDRELGKPSEQQSCNQPEAA
jgi:transposase